VAIIPADTTVYRFMPVPLHFQTAGGQVTTFNWDPPEFISCTNCFEPVIKPPYSMKFTLEIQNEYSCTTKAFLTIHTFAGGKVRISNAFTPNGDGHNDVFYIMGSQEIKIIKEFRIFNRWGQAVFAVTNVPANDPRFGWNGYMNGKPTNAEAYVYEAVIEFTDGSQQVYKGSVVLIL
jgi:gliding motility-associated-like protein